MEDIHLEEAPASSYISWNKSFELGIPVIDAQHKKLVALCNSLYQGIMSNRKNSGGGWEQSLIDALQECTDYVQTHFHDEEVLMKAARYEGYAKHKKEHDMFTKKILDVVQNFGSVSITSALQFVKFLYDWILSHIAHEDKLIAKPVIEYYRTMQAEKCR